MPADALVERGQKNQPERHDSTRKYPYPNLGLGTGTAQSEYLSILTLGLELLQLHQNTQISPSRPMQPLQLHQTF
jgi:hypothetical protein